MNSKQRAYLRALANKIQPIFQVGKSGLSDNLINQLVDALEVRELIKITFLDSVPSEISVLANEISTRTNSTTIQIVGKKLTIYKTSKKDPKIKLPK